jgi:GntR family transcriptional regulator / MocR family aminotransferase
VDLHVSLDGRRDLAGQIYRQVRAAILDGRLVPGQSLPSSRDLATRLAVSRNTVNAAYDRLVAEGFVTARAGVGTMVSEHIAIPVPNDHGGPDEPGPLDEPGVPLWPRPAWAMQSDPPDLSADEPDFDFRTGMPDARQFPYPTWRALLGRQLRPSATRLGAYADPAGHPGLRAAIARHIGVSRAVPTTGDQVLVTNGTQQALDLVSRVLLAPGDVVAMENPGYPPAWRVFASAGAEVVDVPVDADGLVVDALPSRARLVYVSPSHQFPVGMRMSLSRRLSLLAWAQASGAVIVEDDYDSEFRYTGRPIEPLYALDRTGRVVYVGSFSKTMLPTLRLGFCVPPTSLFPTLRRAKYVLDWHTALPMQAALAEFIDRGLLARHIRRMRGVYRARRDLITTCLDRDFADRLTIVSSLAGLHLTTWLRSGSAVESLDLVLRAAAAGVAVQPLANFSRSGPPPAGLLIGYGLIPLDRIEEGLRRLLGCFAS